MARRSDHSREELHEITLMAARDIAEDEGLRGVTARRIAREIGYTVGTIYNLFVDLDDLIIHLNGQTLDRLYEALAEKSLETEPESALRLLADGYTAFVSRQPKLWNVVFEHRLPEPKKPPDWYFEKTFRLLGLVEQALAPMFAEGLEEDRLHTARVLWASLHGICCLESGGKLADTETVPAMVETLITRFLSGLRNQGGEE